MNLVTTDIKDMLVGESSLGLTFATDLFIGRMPNNPDNCVCLYDLAGQAPLLSLQKSTSNYYYNGLFIKVRNTSYQAAWNKAFAILQFLHAHGNVVLNGTLYTLIRALENPQLIEWDENNRPVFGCNFEVQRRASGGIGEMKVGSTFKIG